MKTYQIEMNWKGLSDDIRHIGTFIVDEDELDVLEDEFSDDASIDVLNETQIKRKYTFADVLRTAVNSYEKNFGALVLYGLSKQQ